MVFKKSIPKKKVQTITKHNLETESLYQSSNEIIENVLLQEKINSMFEIPHSDDVSDKISFDYPLKNKKSKVLCRKTIDNRLSSESIQMEENRNLIQHKANAIEPKNNNENLSNITEEEKAELNEEEKSTRVVEESENYLRSGFSKDDVFSTTFEFSDFSEIFNNDKKNTNRNILLSKSQFRENSFKKRLDIETFLGKKFIKKSKEEPKAREYICYENIQNLKTKNKRCPCYSNCQIY